jgi:outer membrane protein TolC
VVVNSWVWALTVWVVAAEPAPEPTWTVERVARRSVLTSNRVREAEAREEQANAVEARTRVGVLPRTSASLTYTRLSNVDNDPLVSVGVDLADVADDVEQVQDPAAQSALQAQLAVLQGLDGFAIDVPLDRYGLAARLSYPVSQVFLEVLPGLRAVGRVAEAREWEIRVARNDEALIAIQVYLDHVLAQSALLVAQQSVEDARVNRAEAVARLEAELSTRPEVLRFEARLAEAEQQAAERRADVLASAAALRARLDLDGAGPIAAEEVVGLEPSPSSDPQPDPEFDDRSVEVWVDRGLSARPELEALTQLIAARRAERTGRRGAMFPTVGVVGGLDVAQPNPLFVPPNGDEFRTVWSLSAVLAWSPDGALAAHHAAEEARARQGQVEAQLDELKDGIVTEVRQAHARLEAARVALRAADRQIEAAGEALAGRRASYREGLDAATEVIDAELQLSRARLSRVRATTAIRLQWALLQRSVGVALWEDDPGSR